jgi:hypothetical protein
LRAHLGQDRDPQNCSHAPQNNVHQLHLAYFGLFHSEALPIVHLIPVLGKSLPSLWRLRKLPLRKSGNTGIASRNALVQRIPWIHEHLTLE